MSTEAPSLAAALAAVQRKLPDVRKAETAHVRSDKGNYSYRYATLPDITKAVLPLLGENGLAWVTRPTIKRQAREEVEQARQAVIGKATAAIEAADTEDGLKEVARRITEAVSKRRITENDGVSLRQKLVAKREVIAGMSEE
jgi:hypothetical protein